MTVGDYALMPKKSGIYKITNKSNNKFYIGSAVNLYLRIQKHNYELKNNKHSNKHLQRSYNKNGGKMFEVDVLMEFDSIDYKELLSIEADFIKSEKAIEKGYNQMIDNNSFFSKLNKTEKHINSVKKSCSKPVMGFDRFTGELVYELDSVSEAARIVKTASSNISSCCKGLFNFIKGIVWIYANEYSIEKDYSFKEHALKGKKFSKKHIKNLREKVSKVKGITLYVYDKDLNFVNKFQSMAEAERHFGLKKESLKNKIDLKELHKGHYWKKSKL